MQGLSEQIIRLHRKAFGTPPDVISFAPGRVEVLGNHTDYNMGAVLSTAIDLGHCFAISSSNTDAQNIRLLIGDWGQIVDFDLESRSPGDGAARYVKGVFYYLKKSGLPICSWNCSFLGNIPIGSGLSSSAALEVSSAFAAQEFCGQWLSSMETAKLCQEAEQQFAGCNCGLLDQVSSIYGKAHSLVHSDFRNLQIRNIPLMEDIIFLILIPQIAHELADSPYNERRASCEKAVTELNGLLSSPVQSLREVNFDEFDKLKNRISPEAAKRAAHVIGEIERVRLGEQAILNKDIDHFGHLMYQSHESSRCLFENSTPEQDRIVEIARNCGALGARLTGGGWGGSLIALTRKEEAKDLSEKIAGQCSKVKLPVRVLSIEASGGAQIIQNRENRNE